MSDAARIEKLERLVKGLSVEVETLRVKQGVDDLDLTPERLLAIKMIARASARGDKGPLREWNRMRRAEFEAERRLKEARS